MPLYWFTPYGNRLKAVQVIGKALGEIRGAAFALDTRKKTRDFNFIPDISIRRQLLRIPLKKKPNQRNCLTLDLVTSMGYGLRAEEILGKPLSAIEALSARVNARRSLETEEILWTPQPAQEALASRIKGWKDLSLSDFGKVVEIVKGWPAWEIILGLEVSKLQAQGIDLEEALSRNAWALESEHGILANIDGQEAERVVSVINKKFGLGVGLLDEKMSEIVSREFTNQLLARGIFWFHEQGGERIVGNAFIRGIDPRAYPQWGGLLVGRPKA